jgi:hypothetical protein
MSETIIEGGFIAVLIYSLCAVVYQLGKKNVENRIFREKADRVRGANAARASLRDNSVVERLHDKYKR